MSARWPGRCATAGAALLIAAGTGGATWAVAKHFALAITGEAGARYEGECTLTTAAGEATIALAGVVPRHEAFTAEAIACRIASAGSITVEIAHDGSVSRSTIKAGTARVAAR